MMSYETPSRANSSPKPGFSSFKTATPITYPGRWPRDALIQSTLDPSIASIEPWLRPLSGSGYNFAYVCITAAERTLITLADGPRRELPTIAGIDHVRHVTRAEVSAEPERSLYRAIWAAKNDRVPTAFLTEVLAELTKGREWTVGDLAKATNVQLATCLRHIFALSSQGITNLHWSLKPAAASLVTVRASRPPIFRAGPVENSHAQRPPIRAGLPIG